MQGNRRPSETTELQAVPAAGTTFDHVPHGPFMTVVTEDRHLESNGFVALQLSVLETLSVQPSESTSFLSLMDHSSSSSCMQTDVFFLSHYVDSNPHAIKEISGMPIRWVVYLTYRRLC